MATIPARTLNGVTFFPVPAAGDRDLVFGFRANQFFPRDQRPNNIPREYTDLAENLFFNGGALPVFAPEVDRAAAFRAVKAWLCSWDPPHESKIDTVAYAIWVWTTPEAVKGS